MMKLEQEVTKMEEEERKREQEETKKKKDDAKRVKKEKKEAKKEQEVKKEQEAKKEQDAKKQQEAKKDQEAKMEQQDAKKEQEAKKDRKRKMGVITCSICLEDLEDGMKVISCNNHKTPHMVCGTCLGQHQETREDTKSLEACPSCDGSFKLPEMIDMLDGSDFITRYDFRVAAQMDVNAKCPNCGKQFRNDNVGAAGVGHCVDGCGHKFCLKCMDPLHSGELCKPPKKKNHFESEDDQAMRKAGFSKCLYCCDRVGSKLVPFVRVESGCNKLTCKTCNRNFCAICCADLKEWCEQTGIRYEYDHIMCPAQGNAAKCKKPGCTHCPLNGPRETDEHNIAIPKNALHHLLL